MDTSKLKKFAQYARRSLIEQVQSKLKLVLAQDSAARREHPQAVKALEAKQKEFGDDQQLIEQVAYTWFNRFCALRFMDANQYNRIMVVSPIAGQFQPEILAEAKAGHLDDSVFDAKTSDKIRGLLSGAIPSRDGQAEAYRLIIVAMCNAYHRLMPYLFERIEDYTELLMPEDLLSGNSILTYTREAMTPENCESVESIGWLYQFYISEKKDQVFEGLKKNKKITPENIPAATQLFTPHWIVKYLVENSLGRLWMLNNPNSKVIEQMEYYIKPVEEEEDFLKIASPEELKICDPAAGSGHMLTYAYDLLYAIYLDANYDPVDIPELILSKNLYGIEIDERAAELAAFALSMKAMKGNPFDDSNNRRRFFRNPIKPNICRIEKVIIDEDALEEYIEFAGKELFTADVRVTLKEFEEADNFGSLIHPTLKDPTELLGKLESKDAQVDLFLKDTHESILKILRQARYLSPVYHVVTANPPYLGSKGMNPRMSKWIKSNYKEGKADLFACFISRNLALSVESGMIAMITMQSWMFQSSFELLRLSILNTKSITTLLHLGTRAFDSIGGEVVSTASFVIKNSSNQERPTTFINLTKGNGENDKEALFRSALIGESKGLTYLSTPSQLNKIPGSPLAYWVSDKLRALFLSDKKLSDVGRPRQGLASTNNDMFYRLWFEIPLDEIKFNLKNKEDAIEQKAKWLPLNKGGSYRKWYGNFEYIINFENDGKTICDYIDNTPGARVGSNGRVINREFYYKPGISYSDLTTGGFGARYFSNGFIFDTTGPSIFDESNFGIMRLLSYVNTPVFQSILDTVCSGLHYSNGVLAGLPVHYPHKKDQKISFNVNKLIELSKIDWDSQEVSWGFQKSPLLAEQELESGKLRDVIKKTIASYEDVTNIVRALEEENNSLFIEELDLQDEFDSSVEKKDITLVNNVIQKHPNKDHEELRSLHCESLLVDYISYFVGVAFGRYSLDLEGLVLANKNETFNDFLMKVPSPTFVPDEDNVIPIIDFEGDWFEDDITERFKEFLKVTFGEENFAENLAFIEEAIGKDIRKYFVKDFYAEHVKRYKKRPIYWMFSSPKGSFNALIYMHRYQPDTVSIVLNDYLREFRTKLEARKESYEQVEISASASQKDKTNAIKAISKINKVLEEINDYEHDILYPLAGEKIEIDLDDGVKHNYPLFGKALKKITGLS